MTWDELDHADTQSFDEFTAHHATHCDAELALDVELNEPVRTLDGVEALPAAFACDTCGARYVTAVPVADVPTKQRPRS